MTNTQMESAPADVAGWIGRCKTAQDKATPLLARRMAGLLDRAAPGPGTIWPRC